MRPRLDGTTLVVDAGQERRIRPDLLLQSGFKASLQTAEGKFPIHSQTSVLQALMKDEKIHLRVREQDLGEREIVADYKEGETLPVVMHDGSRIVLRKLEAGYDPTNRVVAQ